MDVKSTWIPTWHQMDHVFMVSWTILKNHLLEVVGLTQNHHETMALWTTFITQNTLNHVVLCYHVWGHAIIEIHWNSIWLRVWSHMTSHYPWGSVTNYMSLEVSWNGLWTLSFGLSQFHSQGSWLVCEVAQKWDTQELKCKHDEGIAR